MSFEIDSLVEIQNVGIQRVVADYGHELHVVNDETGAVARVPAAWCELVELPMATQADDLGAAMAAAEAAPDVVLLDPPPAAPIEPIPTETAQQVEPIPTETAQQV